MMRTHSCGELRASDAGSEVRLAGWVHHRRDHGKIIFLDLRDASGTVQVVVHPDVGVDAESVHREYCVSIGGTVEKRKPGTENANLPTGESENTARRIEVV